MAAISLTVNGTTVSADIEDRTLLVHFLREELRLTGTHIGCDTSQCGCCTVHLDGRAIKSCTMFAAQADGHAVTTIEGMAGENGELHPIQAAFQEHHGLQCGYCTPGMIMMAADLLSRHAKPDETTIKKELEGNLCRCTGYVNIIKAIASVAEA